MIGFGGHMTSVSFLHVHVEEHSCVEEEDLELSTTANLFSQVPDLSDYFFNRGGKEKKEGREVRIDPRVSERARANIPVAYCACAIWINVLNNAHR